MVNNQLSHVTTFSGAPDTWGLLLRTINLWPRQPTSIATFTQIITVACGDIVNIYDAVTFMFQQSIHAPGTIVKIQSSPDGSILFFAHSFSVTMWDVQTGGLIHTFTTQSQINDITVSTTGDYLACGLSSGFIILWNTQNKKEGKGFGDSQPVVTTCWLSPEVLAVATQNSLYIYNISVGETLDSLPIPGSVWGMVFLEDKSKFLVGTLQSGSGVGMEECHFVAVKWTPPHGSIPWKLRKPKKQPPMYTGQLLSATLIGAKIVCKTLANRMQLFHVYFYKWTNAPPFLDVATSVAMSLNRNLVVQTRDSIQIFSADVLYRPDVYNDAHSSHVYPLGENHIICVLQPTRCLALLELGTLRKLHPDENTPSLRLSLTDPSAAGCGLVSNLGVSAVVEAWQSGTPLPEWTEAVEEDVLLCAWSPEHTHVVTVYNSPQWELHVKHVEDGITLAKLPLEDADFGAGKVYNLAFDSKTRFQLKVDGPGQHIQIPYDITTLPSGGYSHTITKGEPVHLSEPRTTPPYTLDDNCEWVLNAESKKICWISPGNLRRGHGGHFWAGLSLIMVGDDEIVRKVTFKEPDC